MDQKWNEAAIAYSQLQEQLRNEQINANQASEGYATLLATEQSKWQQQSDNLTYQLQMLQDEAEQNRLDKVQAQNQMKQMMQNFDEERGSLKSEL
eukprot:2146721-Karenia_brevis.AAC.1